MIRFQCSFCRKRVRASDGLAGKLRKCPGCSVVQFFPLPKPEMGQFQAAAGFPMAISGENKVAREQGDQPKEAKVDLWSSTVRRLLPYSAWLTIALIVLAVFPGTNAQKAKNKSKADLNRRQLSVSSVSSETQRESQPSQGLVAVDKEPKQGFVAVGQAGETGFMDDSKASNHVIIAPPPSTSASKDSDRIYGSLQLPSPTFGSGSKTVYVNGYYRQNGTWVQSHYRSAPHRR